MTLKSAIAEVRDVTSGHIRLTSHPATHEYVVTDLRLSPALRETTRYYTDDLDDAVDTAIAMATSDLNASPLTFRR